MENNSNAETYALMPSAYVGWTRALLSELDARAHDALRYGEPANSQASAVHRSAGGPLPPAADPHAGAMTIPHYDTVRDVPLLSEDDVIERLDELLGEGLVLRLWFVFLDERGCQLSLMLPVDLPGAPDEHDDEFVARFASDLVEGTGAATVVVVVEWGELDSPCDALEWLRVARGGLESSGLAFLGPFECSPFGVRAIRVRPPETVGATPGTPEPLPPTPPGC